MPQCSFTQELFSEDDGLEETIPIKQPWVNVINLSHDYVDNSPGPRCHAFIFNLSNGPSTCVIPPQGPLVTPITPTNRRIKRKWSNIFSHLIDATMKNSKKLVGAMDYVN
jgi:hypothetical protein